MLITSDLQFTDNPRDSYRLRWFERFIKLVQQKKPRAVAILGDLTEEKDRHSARLVNTIVDYLYELTKVCRVYGLQGNHDYVADPDNGFWPFLSRIDGVTWINRPTSFRTELGELLFLPHTRDYKRDWKNLSFDQDWIFAHNTFEGTETEHGFKLEGIPLSVFPRLSRVISGDVHTPQTTGCVTYVGSPYLCDFGDDYTPRILWLEPDSMRSLTCPGAQKRLIDIRSAEELELQKHVRSGDILKVRVNLSMKDRERWPDVRRAVEDWAKTNGCTLHACLPQFKIETADRKQLRNMGKRSDEDTLKKYAASCGLGDSILKTGMELL